ncbi:MAG: hypothetical protein QXS20_07265 [Candidatus Thorarchaeota archaeon]
MGSRRVSRHSRRGYPVAVLVDVGDQMAVIWIVYSESLKMYRAVHRDVDPDSDTRGSYYNFYGSIVSALKPVFASGVSTTIVTGPTDGLGYAEAFVGHVRGHHKYLLKSVQISVVRGGAGDSRAARALVDSRDFESAVKGAVDTESGMINALLGARLYDETGRFGVLYTLDEIEECLTKHFRAGRNFTEIPEHIFVTSTFWTSHRTSSRFRRIIDLANSHSVKTRVVEEDTDAGVRISQLGGIVCVTTRRVALDN